MQQLADLDLVRAFVEVAETLSFAQAARALARDPTAISRRVGQLERQLGVRLIERSTRRLTLTEAGATYLARAEAALRDLDRAGIEAAELADGEPRGHLRVSLPTTFGRLWINGAICGFVEAHPHISFEAAYSNHYVDLIGDRFDLAIRFATLSDSRLIARRIGDRRRALCASPAYLRKRGTPRTLADLADHECLRFTPSIDPNAWHFAAPDGGRVSAPIAGRLASDDADVLVEAAVRGQGLLNATEWLVVRELAAGTLVRVVLDRPLVEDGGIYIVHPSSRGVPSKTRAFIDWLVGALAEAPWSRGANG